ncbi:MAG: hypothetical protein Q8M19_15455, partial [Reyranella sp.]|nr:hypothetical protein [Reyranella sp.]
FSLAMPRPAGGGFPTRFAFFDTRVSENGRRKALPINALNFPTGFSRHRGVGKKALAAMSQVGAAQDNGSPACGELASAGMTGEP